MAGLRMDNFFSPLAYTRTMSFHCPFNLRQWLIIRTQHGNVFVFLGPPVLTSPREGGSTQFSGENFKTGARRAPVAVVIYGSYSIRCDDYFARFPISDELSRSQMSSACRTLILDNELSSPSNSDRIGEWLNRARSILCTPSTIARRACRITPWRVTIFCSTPDPSITQVCGTPSPYHLLDHEYGITPKDQIITRPLLSPVKTQVCVR